MRLNLTTGKIALALTLAVLPLTLSATAQAGGVITSGGTLRCSFTTTPYLESGFEGDCLLWIEGVSDLGGPGGVCGVPHFIITTGPTTGGPFMCGTDSGPVPSPNVVTNVHCSVTIFTVGADGRVVDIDVYESFHGTIVVRDGLAIAHCPAPNAP